MSPKHPSKTNAVVFALIGELGSGKTTFVQNFVRACGIDEVVTSPTFVILKKYGTIIHIDAYRLKHSKELLDLGINDLIANPDNVLFIEWADKVMDVLPDDHFTIHFTHVDETHRKISID